jgi:DNA polymerase elongation subunit (family B)
MKDGFKRKAEAKANDNPVMEKTWKIVINSAYGFFGLRWMDKRGIKFLSGEQLDAYLEEGKVFNYNQINETEFMVDMENDLYDIKGKSIAVAAAVTSFARMKLYSVMKDIIDHGKKIFYSDTDSIITDCNIKEYPDLLEKY